MNELEKKMMNHVLLFIVMSRSFYLGPAEMKEPTRNKRVLYGLEAGVEHRDDYEVFRYYVLLSKTQPGWFSRAFFKWFWDEGRVLTAPDPEDLSCGGSLLTPSIVQTAAHCIATLTEIDGNNLTHFLPKNVWEDRRYSYVGSNVITKMVDYLSPKHYIVYQASRRLGGFAGYAMYDFGLVLTKRSIHERAPNAPISYVPVYKGEGIREFYYDAISKEYMCLHVGHGLWNVLYNHEGQPYIGQRASDLIRWGWRTLMNYIDCEHVTYDPRDRRHYPYNYTRDATWVCSQAFENSLREREFLYHTSSGDSGGPVTCNNVYFAVVSMGSTGMSQHIITYDSPVIHTLFENSAEYRDDFIRYCDEIRWDRDRPIPNPVYPDLTVTPPPDPFARSQCAPTAVIHNFLLLLTFYSFLIYYFDSLSLYIVLEYE